MTTLRYTLAALALWIGVPVAWVLFLTWLVLRAT